MSTSSQHLSAPPAGRRHPLRQVGIVCALVWTVMAAYAHVDFPIRVFGFELSKANLMDSAQKPSPAAVHPNTMPARGSAVAPTPAPSATSPMPTLRASSVAVDPNPQRILMIGDSMVEKLMLRLADYCLDNGHQFLPAIWYASTTTGWARDAKLTRLLARFKPTFVIIALGSSELTRRRIDLIEVAVRNIVRRLGPRKFVWVGPPNWRKDTGINDVLARTLGPGRFFLSADLPFERASDGIHPTRASSAHWMDAIATWIVHGSDVPIVLSPPTHSAPRPVARVFPPTR